MPAKNPGRVIIEDDDIPAYNAVLEAVTAFANEHEITVHLNGSIGDDTDPEVLIPGVVHIYFNSAPTYIDNEAPRSIFGHQLCLEYMRDGTKPSGQGKLILDEDYPVAEIVGNTIYILFNLCGCDADEYDYDRDAHDHSVHGSDCQVVKQILSHILKQTVPFLSIKGIVVDEAEQRVAFAQALLTTSGQMLHALTDREKRATEKLREAEALIFKAAAERRQTAVLRAMFASADVEQLAKMYDEILELEEVQSAVVHGQMLQIFTNVIHIVHGGKTYEIGEFEININLVQGNVRFRNRTRQVSYMHHPHVDDMGMPCFGNISGIVPQMVAEGQLLHLTILLLTFLKSFNEHDDGAYIHRWPTVTKAKLMRAVGVGRSKVKA